MISPMIPVPISQLECWIANLDTAAKQIGENMEMDASDVAILSKMSGQMEGFIRAAKESPPEPIVEDP